MASLRIQLLCLLLGCLTNLSLAQAPVGQPPLAGLNVEQAAKVAIEHNPRYLSALKLVEAAQAQLGQAYAPYYPTLDLSLSDTHTSTESVADGNTLHVAAGALNLNYTILDFGRRHLAMQSMEASLEAARQGAETTRQDVILQVRQQFYQTHADQETLRIQKEQVRNQEHHLNQAQGYYKAGLQARNEVTKAASDLANAELTLVQAKNTLQLDWVSLNVAMGLPRDTAYNLRLPPVEETFLEVVPQQAVELAYRSRPEALQFKDQIDSTLYQMETHYANRYPNISATFGTGVQGPGLPLPWAWNAGFVLNLNLFNGFLDRYGADNLRAQAASLAQQLEQTRKQIYKDVMSA